MIKSYDEWEIRMKNEELSARFALSDSSRLSDKEITILSVISTSIDLNFTFKQLQRFRDSSH